jgi:hypothetical protein
MSEPWKSLALNFGTSKLAGPSLWGKQAASKLPHYQEWPKLTVRVQRLTSGYYLAAFWAAGIASRLETPLATFISNTW